MADPVVTNIIIGGAKVWYAPYGEAIPDETDVKYDDPWGGNWARIGFTKAPLTVAYEAEEMDVEVEEELSAIDRLRTKETARLETVLAELTGSYLSLAMGQDPADATVTPAAVDQVGFEEIALGGQSALRKWTVGFEGRYVDATGAEFPVRLFFHKATMKLNGSLEFSQRSGNYPGIPLQVNALADPTKPVGQKLLKFQRVTEAASA